MFDLNFFVIMKVLAKLEDDIKDAQKEIKNTQKEIVFLTDKIERMIKVMTVTDEMEDKNGDS